MKIIYTPSKAYTEKGGLCDLYKEGYYYDNEGDRVFVKVGYIGYNGVYHPSHLFIKEQITAIGNHVEAETIELGNNPFFEVSEFTIRREMLV